MRIVRGGLIRVDKKKKSTTPQTNRKEPNSKAHAATNQTTVAGCFKLVHEFSDHLGIDTGAQHNAPNLDCYQLLMNTSEQGAALLFKQHCEASCCSWPTKIKRAWSKCRAGNCGHRSRELLSGTAAEALGPVVRLLFLMLMETRGAHSELKHTPGTWPGFL